MESRLELCAVIFRINCSATKPGEVVFIVGGHKALGDWSPAHAVPLTTTAEKFPEWCSDVVLLPGDNAVEYKFIVQPLDRNSSPKWEAFKGTQNRSISAVVGSYLIVRCTWSDMRSITSVNPLKSKVPAASEDVASPKVDGFQRVDSVLLVKMAESGVEKAASEVNASCALAVRLNERMPERRNFSQSLLAGVSNDDVDDVSKLDLRRDSEDSTSGQDTVVIQTQEEDDQGEKETRQGVSLQNISSFTALSTMADVEEKTLLRKSSQSCYEPFNLNVPIVIVSSEIAPWSKTGGLGIIASSYSYEFAMRGHLTMAVSPKYSHYEHITRIGETNVLVNGKEERVTYWHRYMSFAEGKGCDYVFVDHPSIQRDGGLYNDNDGREYGDNLFRFTILSLAAMEAPLVLQFLGSSYGDKVMFLANDWQAGLIPVYLCHKYRTHGVYLQARAMYVVHNLGYQGQYHNVDSRNFFNIGKNAASDISLGNCVNLAKGAIICADRVLTVSPNYANEIQTPEGGFNLQDFVSAKAHSMRLAGILNGIDESWNPEADCHISTTYSINTVMCKKSENKTALQRRLGLHDDAGCVLVGFVGRLTWQKGVDVLGQVIDWMMQDSGNGVNGHAQLIMMGNGEKQHADMLRSAEERYRGRICGFVGFDPTVEHQMMAGCDLFLVPSRYEPCGLPQMCAQLYGTLPIVTATGGLVDSVRDISEGLHVATGFHVCNLTENMLKECLYKAMETYLMRPDDFTKMQSNAMAADFSWPKAIDEYERHIDTALYDRPVQPDR